MNAYGRITRMSLNIKNEHVHELAREAARRTGRTQTGAIQLALEKLLEETDAERQREERAKRIDAVLAEVDAIVTDEMRREIRAYEADMYDEDGLPK